MASSMKKRENHKSYGWLVLAIAVVIILWMANLFFLIGNEDRSAIGDMFGAANALFAGLAFAVLIYAILLQREDLKIQRSELELTRNELEGQKVQLERQNATLKKQNFENTFFQLLGFHNEIVNTMMLHSGSNTLNGRECFKYFYREFVEQFRKNAEKHKGKQQIEIIDISYAEYNERFQDHVGHYFRYLYNIVKVIHISDNDNKQLYINLLRAELSIYELTLLFYVALSSIGKEKFKPLIEKYALLKKLPKHHLIDPENHFALYNSSAFGGVESA